MPPAPRTAEREEERRLNTRTLTIASVASASAAAVTSQLWIAGTWIAAALTPVLVALISEAMHRPTERIARAWTSERDVRPARAQTATREEPAAVSGTAGPVRVYRQTSRGAQATGRGALATGRGAAGQTSASRGAEPVNGGAARTSLSRPSALSRRRIAIGTVAATAAIAFVVGIVALTTADLVSGGSVGKGSGRSTLFSGSGNGSEAKKDTQESGEQEQQQDEEQQQAPDGQQTAPTDEPTTTDPAPDETPPSDTAPVEPPSSTPPGEPVPQSTP